MPIIEGSGGIKDAWGEYDFAVDGGAVGTFTLRGDGGIPNGAVILGGFVDVTTAVTSGGAATGALQAQGAGDLVAGTVVSGAPWSTTGVKSVVPAFTGATAIKLTAARNLAFVVAVAALTAGKFRAVVFYR